MTLSILTFTETILSLIYQGILGTLSGGLNAIFSTVGLNANAVLGAFVVQLNTFGVFMPLIMVALFGLAGAGIYLELGVFRAVDTID